MRDFIKVLLVGMVILFSPYVKGEEDYRVLVIPDNVVTENIALDSFIYNASAEFFADEIVTLLNSTDFMSAPTVSETRAVLKENPATMISAKNLTNKFKTTYNIDYVALRKIVKSSSARYALLLTSHIDAENYILRRTPWDFLNIPGASVVDPAYKISTYAVLVDTEYNKKLWSETFYKTISVCENRIITRGPSPQTEQLQKIKDYSRYVCPQIAQNVQQKVLPPDVLAQESSQIYYDMGNIDNVFTKKYRHLGKEYDKVYKQRKADAVEFVENTKVKADETAKKIKNSYDSTKKKLNQKKQTKLEVKATPVLEENSQKSGFNEITNKVKEKTDSIKNTIFKKESNELEYPELINIEIKKKKRNNLYGDYSADRPDLRDYD
ncbi:hypothetical protein IJD34_05065 [bacterium]|nr:hypothetical protein [bacterium]